LNIGSQDVYQTQIWIMLSFKAGKPRGFNCCWN